MKITSLSSSLLLILLSIVIRINSFKWHLSDQLPPARVLTFSERYMFASKHGPPLMQQGNSYIDVNAVVTSYMTLNKSISISMATYAVLEGHHHDTLEGMCGERDIRNNKWASNVDLQRNPTSYVGERTIIDTSLNLNGTYYVWNSLIKNTYVVSQEAWYNVAFQICSTEALNTMSLVVGDVSFRNPYGYIPAELFGLLPFEIARVIAYFVFGIFFLFYYCKHRSSTLPLHNYILFVFLVALIESAVWYAAYQLINISGEPYCCPFPPVVIAALVLQLFRQTFARMLLLIISLGYGIVRPKLLNTEWIAIIVVSTLYFITATIAQVDEILVVQDVRLSSNSSLTYQVPALFMDVIFLTWIYKALTATIRILTEFQQTYKLQMYKQLATTIGLFVTLFAIVTILIILDKSSIIQWPWQWAWAQQVLWEILNFSVLASVCLVCRPSDRSQMLSYASQLPTEDPDDDLEDNDTDKKFDNNNDYEDDEDLDGNFEMNIRKLQENN